jgi:hypothetical protein
MNPTSPRPPRALTAGRIATLVVLVVLPCPPASAQPASPLLRALAASSGTSAVPLDARHLAEVGRLSGKPVPRRARLRALVVRRGAAMLGAFLALVPRGHKRCSEEADEAPKVFWLSAPPSGAAPATLRLSEVKTRAFDSLKPTVELPELHPRVPFFTVEYSPDCENLPPGGGSAYSDVKVVEIWSLTAQGASSPKRFRSHTFQPAGTVTIEVDWIAGRRQTFYLAAKRFSKGKTPLTSAPSGAADEEKGYFHSCERQTKVYALTPAGAWSEVAARRLATLRLQEPALRKLPRDAQASGKSEEHELPACEALGK